MSVVVQTVKVHPHADVADVRGCRDGVAIPWCWYGRCKWQLCRWGTCMYTLVVMVLMPVVVQIVKVHPGVGDADISSGRDGVGTP